MDRETLRHLLFEQLKVEPQTQFKGITPIRP